MSGSLRSAASVSSAIRSISGSFAPDTLIPMGVRMPVESMSSRPLMGMVQALEIPGSWSAASISALSSSEVMRSRQKDRSGVLSHSGAHDENQRGFSRHSASGLRTMVVSIIEKGAGSVEVLARPAFPKTLFTSGKVRRILSWICRAAWASATDMPGCTADGM